MLTRPNPLARLIRHAHGYRVAARDFTHDAKHYLLTVILQNAGYGILGTVFALYVKERGFSEAVVGDVEGALAVAGAVVCLMLPPLVNSLGYRTLFMVAALAAGFARIGQAFAPGALSIVGLGLLFGVGDGIMQTLSTAFLSENAGKAVKTHLFTTDFLLRVAAMFAGSLIGGLMPAVLRGMISEVDAYRWTIVVAGVLMAASALTARSITQRQVSRELPWRAYARSVRAFRSWGRLARLLVPETLIALGAGLVMPFVALFLKHRLGASVEQVGMIQAVSSVIMGVGAFLTPAIAKRFGLAGTVVLTEVLSLPFLVAIPMSTSLPVVAGLMWARGALMNMSWPIYNQLSMEGLPAEDKPLVAGWIRFGWSIAWLAGSSIGGRLMESSYTTPYFFTAALYAMGATATFLLLRSIKVDSPSTSAGDRAAV